MEPPAQPGAKVCVRCGRDCSSRRRVKDSGGRYLCGECLDREQPGLGAAGPRPAAAPTSVEPIPAEPDIIPLAAEPPGARAGAECPNCGTGVPSGAATCARCGFNRRTGKPLGADTPTGHTVKCVQCGYSLAGLKTPRCPECGSLNTPAELRRAAAGREARDTIRNAYVKPLIMFAVGFVISVSVLGATEGGVWAVTAYLIKYAIYVPTGVLGFFLCCLLWLGSMPRCT